MAHSRSTVDDSFFHRHGLGIVAIGLLILWLALYWGANPSTHSGGFFGNAIADWTGTVIAIFGTKYLYEMGSAESRKPHGRPRSPWRRFLRLHSLTLFLLVTGVLWVWLYLKMDSNSKWGQVVGNIVSEWTQVLGLVLLTKRLIEKGSKESS